MKEVARLPNRDQWLIGTALVGVTTIAWLYLMSLAQDMHAGTTGMSGLVMGVHPWTPAEFALTFSMWAVMMVGMMVPSAFPMILVYAAIARKAERESNPVAPVALFVLGYVVVWTTFSLGAATLQWGFDQTALLSPMMVSTSPLLGASLLVLAGIYQLTPVKEACLEKCRSPAHFISERWQGGYSGAWRLGISHGWYCLGCCWALMGLLFFGGVMNLLWVALIAGFVLMEKLLPFGQYARLCSAVPMIGAGLGYYLFA